MRKIAIQIRPFLIFFPILIIMYIGISLIFLKLALSSILSDAGLAVAKLLLLVIIMALYLEISKKHNLVLALRSIWSKLNRKWRRVEDMFIFLELTMRFYPTFQREWQLIGRSRLAIGISANDGKLSKIKSIADDLPGLILQSYKKAENTATVMQQRGYGKVIPRGVANPILFKIKDALFIILILIGFGVVNKYVTI